MRLKNFINGQWVAAEAERFQEVHNPATGEVLALCPFSSAGDVARAVEAAASAFPSWRDTPVPRRAEVLFTFRQRVWEHREELARLIVQENGKTYQEALGEMTRALQYVEHACAIPELMKGSYSEGVGRATDTYYIREPLGVFAVIAPFNFPAMIPLYFTWAVACGDTVVLKPSELCPLTTLRLGELALESGIPPGVLNIVLGGVEVVQALCTHPGVVGVTFVGSSRVAEEVYRLASSHGKRVQSQGGAKNHLVVTPEAALDACMGNIVSSCFGNASQRCFAGSNLLVLDPVYEAFLEGFLGAVRSLVLGYGMDPGVNMGPVISRDSLLRLEGVVEEALKEGARPLLDGRGVKVPRYPNGYFLGPTVLEAEPGMRVFDEEVFGPVRCVKRVRDLGEAIDIINGSAYGHSAVIYTENGGQARDFILGVNCGQVGVNVGTPAPIAFYPVGGRKRSFYGSLRGRANDAVDFYTDKKVVVATWHTRLR